MRGTLACLLVWFSTVFVFAPPAGAHVVGTQPLSEPEFYNQWNADSPKWKDVVDRYYAGDLTAAKELLLKMRASGADDELVSEHLAVVFKDLGEFDQAAGEYRRLVKLHPDDAHRRIDLGYALLSSEDAKRAAEAFQAALEIDGEEASAYLGLGLARIRQDDPAAAVRSLTEAVLIDERLALGWETLGTLHQEAGRYEAAASAFETALKLDPSYLPDYFRLAQVYDALGRYADAWDYYKRSSRIFSWNDRIKDRVEAFVAAHRDFVMQLEEADRRRRQKPVHLKVTPVPADKQSPQVKVGLAEKLESLSFSAGGSFTAAGTSGEKRLRSGLPGGAWQVRFDGQALALTGPDGVSFRVDAGEGLRLHLDDSSATWILFDLEMGSGYFWARQDDRQVRGDLLILKMDEGLTVVNELDLEAYLLSVVPSEMYPNMHSEALKAQAIAARTYTLRNFGRYKSRGFDVLGSVASSEYKGVEQEHRNTTQAVLATRGQVMTSGGRLIEAFYSASAGGYTASSEDVWGGKRSYLQAVPEWDEGEGPTFHLGPRALENWFKQVPSVYSSRSRFGIKSTFRWERLVSAAEISARVGQYQDIGDVLRIVPGPRGVGGRLQSVTVVGTLGTYEAKGDRIRSRMGGLKSNAFKVEPISGTDGVPESFIFYGAGFGHGVGLSQLGAAGMAEAGVTARGILEHYFRGVSITPNYNRGS